MKHARALFLFATATIIAAACGETDETTNPGGGADASLDTSSPKSDAATPTDSAVADTATPTPDSSTDANVTDAAVDAGPCPIDTNATVTAAVKITADDYLTLWVNGALVDNKLTTWGTVDTPTITLFRHPSRKNVIAVEGRNAQNQGGPDRGVLADIVVSLASGDAGADSGLDAGSVTIVTEATTWKMATNALADAGLPDGGLADAGVAAWFDPAYDDSTWVAAVSQGMHGIGPWGSVFGTSTAHWLWSYDVADASAKPVVETVYLRKSFYFDKAGALSNTATACP